MMLPMERSEVFKILSDIFCQKDDRYKKCMRHIIMSESVGFPYDIDFRCEYTGKIRGYLRIVNPPEDCVDGEYCFVYHLPSTQETGNIAIDSSGNIRVYGDNILSSIYDAIKDNANRLADYVKKLTLTYQNQVADTVVSTVKTYCEILMSEHASTFDQMDMPVDRDDCKFFYMRSLNSPHMNFQFDVVSHIDTISIPHNEVWIRFSVVSGNLWTPITINPYIGQVVIHAETTQPVFTDIFNAKELVRLARLISERTGFAISVGDGSSIREQNLAKYIKSLLQKHEVLDTVKQFSTEKDEHISCDDVFKVVVDWLREMSSCSRIKDARDINYLHHTLIVRNSIGCSYMTKELKVSYASYMKSIEIYLNDTLIITIDDLGLGDTRTCVYINKYNHNCVNVLNDYLIACLAEVLKDKLGMDKLRAYYSSESKYLELIHCGTTFFFNDGITAYAIDPEFVITKENIDKTNNENNKSLTSIVDDVVDKKIDEFVKTGSMYYTTKDYLCSKICEQLTLRQQEIFRMIYSAIYSTLAESKYTGAAYELERHFMQLVGTDRDQGFHVYFRLDDIHKDLPRFDIEFTKYFVNIRIQDVDDFKDPFVIINKKIRVYTQNIKFLRDPYKTIMSHVASKIVLMDALS